ncbi:Cupredoxin [Myriangium duriaei CBS 260.36]|uniref:Cupredoxin n=1 Tax=Myriangium duriaei CBS 260.36 TaxID=1168546 RepID=A0A9P4IW97_9PEZI|nr:Cupredoxin [Myriangium duriaei CBS 260.36]
MHVYLPHLLLVTHAAVVHGATIAVQVARNGLSFTPNSFAAEVGDQVEFYFVHSGHGVTQGGFSSPCQPSSDGFESGLVQTSDGLPFTITVTNKDPIYFYCPVSTHCQHGMGGAINAP